MTGTKNFNGNRQWASIAMNLWIVWNKVEIPRSYYNKQVMRLIDECPIGPLVRTFKEREYIKKGDFDYFDCKYYYE